MREHTRLEAYYALSGLLIIWGFLLVFENAYFAAGFYGVQVPFWALWVGQQPIWLLNVLDTIAVAAVISLIYLERPRGSSRRRLGSRGSGLLSGIVLLVFLVLVVFVLYSVFHVTLGQVWCALLGFVGRAC